MVDGILPKRLERAITGVLFVSLVLSLVGVGYVATIEPVEPESFTEFYILGPGGNATDYPTNLTVDETGSVIVGISNHENEDLTYTVLFELDNTTVATNAITVGDGETREELMSFTPESPGRQRLRILLYVGTEADTTTEPYRNLRLWVNVSA